MSSQSMYDELIESIREAGVGYGKMKEKESTDDKITLATKNLVRRREENTSEEREGRTKQITETYKAREA